MKDSLAGMFADAEWKSYKLASSPNRIYYNAAKRAAAVVLERSQQRDFALSKKALDCVIDAQHKGEKVEAAFIVLRERGGGSFCAAEEARIVAQNLAETPAREGNYGDYWWINEAFGDPKRGDEVPF